VFPGYRFSIEERMKDGRRRTNIVYTWPHAHQTDRPPDLSVRFNQSLVDSKSIQKISAERWKVEQLVLPVRQAAIHVIASELGAKNRAT
jgi:hypothetical protein